MYKRYKILKKVQKIKILKIVFTIANNTEENKTKVKKSKDNLTNEL